MPKKERVPWNLDFKPEKGDVIGANVIENGLAKLTKVAWLDKRTGRSISPYHKRKYLKMWLL